MPFKFLQFNISWLWLSWFSYHLLAGWDEGVLGMQVGEVARLRVREYIDSHVFLSDIDWLQF